MNVVAQLCGCSSSTVFSNPHGMDAKPDLTTHQSTAVDVAKLAIFAMKNATFRRIVNTQSHATVIQRCVHMEELERSLKRNVSARSYASGDSDTDGDDGSAAVYGSASAVPAGGVMHAGAVHATHDCGVNRCCA
jgi:hypothetical protein